MTLHEAMIDVLAGGGWMTFAEVADLVNESGRYQKGDGSLVEPSQIRLRAVGSRGHYSHLFEVKGDRIRLAPVE